MYDLPESSCRVFLEKPDRAILPQLICRKCCKLNCSWEWQFTTFLTLPSRMLKKRRHIYSKKRIFRKGWHLHWDCRINPKPRIYRVCRIGFRVSKRRVCTIGPISWNHKEPPLGNIVVIDKWQRWEKKIAILQQSVSYCSVWPRVGCASHSLPRIKFKRGFAQQNFSIHAFLQAAHRAAKKKQIKQNRAKQSRPTNQPTKQPNDQQITKPPENKKTNIQPSNQPTKQIQQTTPNQNKSNQAKPKQNKKETNQTNQPPNQQTNQPTNPPTQPNKQTDK